MALSITHNFVSSKTDGSDSTLIRPSNWNDTHAISGTVDETLLSFSDVTTHNASTSAHGLLPKLSGTSTQFLNGSGTWTTPAGGSFDSTANITFTGFDIFNPGLHSDPETNVNAVFINPFISTSFAETFTALNIFVQSPGGTINTVTGIEIQQHNIEDVITTAYGLIIDDMSGAGATTSANIWSKGGGSLHIIEGKMIIGSSTPPTHNLEVDGDTFLSGTVYLGEFPSCPNAKVTIYQSDLSDSTNSSMLDIVGSNTTSITDMTSVVLLTQANSDVSDDMIGLYVRNDVNSGTIATSTAIYIDTSQVSGTVTNMYGLYIADQTGGGNSGAVNIFSAGAGANVFQGPVQAKTYAGAINTTVSGPAPAIDCSTGAIQILELDQNMSPTFTNLTTGQRVTLYVVQGGNFTITWPGNVGGSPNINTSNGSTTIIDFISPDGTNLEPLIPYEAPSVNHVTFSSTPTFDCNAGNTQILTLTGDVTSSTTVNLAVGQQITFVIIQNIAGGHQFVWPANVFGAIQVSTVSSSVNIQTFICADGSNLHASSIGVIS
jgi:hypothetical protein